MSDWHWGHSKASSTISGRHFLIQGFLSAAPGAPALIKEQEDEGHLKETAANQTRDVRMHTHKQVHTEEKLTCPYMLTIMGKKHVISRNIHHTSVQPLIMMGPSLAKSSAELDFPTSPNAWLKAYTVAWFSFDFPHVEKHTYCCNNTRWELQNLGTTCPSIFPLRWAEVHWKYV